MVRFPFFFLISELPLFHTKGGRAGVTLIDARPFLGTYLPSRYLRKVRAVLNLTRYWLSCDPSALMKCLSLVCRFSCSKFR
jgi:hypothetical protein